jgi:hypothetical protein
MKIKIESEKIVKAVKKVDGVEVVLENAADAKEAIQLVTTRTTLFERHQKARPLDIKVTAYQKYETTAVDYKMVYLLEFAFEEGSPLNERVDLIKDLQEFFSKV